MKGGITILIAVFCGAIYLSSAEAKPDIAKAINKSSPLSHPENGFTSLSTLNKFSVKAINAIVYAYNAEQNQTDNSPCITANGYNLCGDGVEDTVANNCLPFGTGVDIMGKHYIVRDRMNKRYGCATFDIFMKNKQDALNWGKKYLEVKIIN